MVLVGLLVFVASFLPTNQEPKLFHSPACELHLLTSAKGVESCLQEQKSLFPRLTSDQLKCGCSQYLQDSAASANLAFDLARHCVKTPIKDSIGWKKSTVRIMMNLYTTTGSVRMDDIGFLELVAEGADDWKPLAMAGEGMCTLGHIEKADAFYRKYIRKDPIKWRNLWSFLMQCNQHNKRNDICEQDCKNALSRFPNMPYEIKSKWYEFLLMALLHQAKYEEGVEYIGRCLREFPEATLCAHKYGLLGRKAANAKLSDVADHYSLGWMGVFKDWELPPAPQCGPEGRPWRVMWPVWAIQNPSVVEITSMADSHITIGDYSAPRTHPRLRHYVESETEFGIFPPLGYPGREAVAIQMNDVLVTTHIMLIFEPTQCDLYPLHFPMIHQPPRVPLQDITTVKYLNNAITLHWHYGNYFHCIVEAVGKLLWLQELGILNSDTVILLPPKLYDSIHEALELLGMGQNNTNRVLYQKNEYVYHIKHLYAVEYRLPQYVDDMYEILMQYSVRPSAKEEQKQMGRDRSPPSPLRDPRIGNYSALAMVSARTGPPLFILRKTRAAILSALLANNENQENIVVYVSRQKAKNRLLFGEDKLIALMKARYGDKLFYHTGGSLAEQVFLFHNASIVIGAHGAGLANILFCRPQTAVIEFPARFYYRSTSYQYVSTALNLHYYSVPNLPQDGLEDFHLNTSNLADIMDTLIYAESRLPPYLELH